jgi:hypothetical protein
MKDITFRLIIQCIGVSFTAYGLAEQLRLGNPYYPISVGALTLLVLGFILSCIDYAKEKTDEPKATDKAG